MGVAARWLKGLFDLKGKKKCRRKEKDCPKASVEEEKDARKRAIAVAAATAAVAEAAVAAAHAAATAAVAEAAVAAAHAAATAAVAEAAVAAAHAAAAVVKLTTTIDTSSSIEWAAAVTIQSRFRGYLSRRALRALKGLVKLQALVRGYLVRKQTVQFLQRLQTLVRVQAKVCDYTAFSSELGIKNSSYLKHFGPGTPEKYEHRARSTKHGGSWCLKKTGLLSTENEYYDVERAHILREDERNVKILEVDSGIPKSMLKSRRFIYPSYYNSTRKDRKSKSFSMSKDTMMSPSSGEVQSHCHFEYDHYNDYENDNLSPTFYSSRGKSSRKGMYTSTKSDAITSCYLVHPNYMAYTESSKAKVRSFSVPKQRYQPLERSYWSTKRYNVYYDSGPIMQRGMETFDNRDYPGSGLLDRLGMPISSHWRRY